MFRREPAALPYIAEISFNDLGEAVCALPTVSCSWEGALCECPTHYTSFLPSSTDVSSSSVPCVSALTYLFIFLTSVSFVRFGFFNELSLPLFTLMLDLIMIGQRGLLPIGFCVH